MNEGEAYEKLPASFPMPRCRLGAPADLSLHPGRPGGSLTGRAGHDHRQPRGRRHGRRSRRQGRQGGALSHGSRLPLRDGHRPSADRRADRHLARPQLDHLPADLFRQLTRLDRPNPFNAFAGHFTLLAIPFFILASTFMSTGGVARRIIRFAIAVVGHFQGGLAIAGVFACMLFAALSGSSPATVVAIGTIVIAGMRQVGYTKDFAAGVICNAGTLGILIPPSIVMVVYASAVDVSVGRMFLAGVIPGLLAGLMLMVGIYVTAKVRNLPAQDWAGLGRDPGLGAGRGLGPVPDRHHPGRHLRRHLHADRGRRGGRGLRLLHRQLRLQGHGAPEGRGRRTPFLPGSRGRRA